MGKSKFRCYFCGWCCGNNIDKYSSREEFDLASENLAKFGIKLQGTKLPNGMILWPKPCPALKKTKKSSSCLIYNQRPYPCRQFLCGKQSKDDTRPFISNNKYNMDYFNNLLLNNLEFAKIKEKIEDKAAEWGNKHGWKLKKVP
jgi:Fe-S-cluster containining protein